MLDLIAFEDCEVILYEFPHAHSALKISVLCVNRISMDIAPRQSWHDSPRSWAAIWPATFGIIYGGDRTRTGKVGPRYRPKKQDITMTNRFHDANRHRWDA